MKGGTKMPKTALLSLKGEKIKDIKLDDNVWGITPNDQVVYEHINLFMANRRQGTHATKTRSDVSGGGRNDSSSGCPYEPGADPASGHGRGRRTAVQCLDLCAGRKRITCIRRHRFE